MPPTSKQSWRLAALKRLADQALEAPDAEALAQLLTGALPGVLGLPEARLLLWNRKLDHFETATPGETRPERLRPAEPAATPEARFLISEGVLLETAPSGPDGVLLPLLARSGLVGMLVLPPRPGRRQVPYRPGEVRALSLLAQRAALAVENSLYSRELIASERMAALGTMAGMLAHDFRGPMTVIRGYAETLLQGEVPPEQVQKRAGLMIEMVDRLERMTAETLDFAREGGRLVRRPVVLATALEELARDLERELPGLEVALDLQLPAEASASLDLDKLRRVATNLAGNARDAMGGKGRLGLSARLAPPSRLELVVGDEGPGVPAEIRERLFEAFVTYGKKGGTGLGLAVARRFVEDHGGTLELLPDGPGAHFRIALPLGGPAAASGAAPKG